MINCCTLSQTKCISANWLNFYIELVCIKINKLVFIHIICYLLYYARLEACRKTNIINQNENNWMKLSQNVFDNISVHFIWRGWQRNRETCLQNSRKIFGSSFPFPNTYFHN